MSNDSVERVTYESLSVTTPCSNHNIVNMHNLYLSTIFCV